MRVIKRTSYTGRQPSDLYFANVYSPFVSRTILLCNSCEILLAGAFKKLGLTYKKRTLGQKLETLKRQRDRLVKSLGREAFDQLVASIDLTNQHFNRAKHAYMVLDDANAKDPRLLEPGFNFATMNVMILDSTTEEVSVLTPADRQRFEDDIRDTIERLEAMLNRIGQVS